MEYINAVPVVLSLVTKTEPPRLVWNAPGVVGKLIERWALLMASVASPKETLGARLKDNVTAGYWPW